MRQSISIRRALSRLRRATVCLATITVALGLADAPGASAQQAHPTEPLAVSVSGQGSVSAPAGWSCPGGNCATSYPWNEKESCIFKPTGPICHTDYSAQIITLAAAPASGWTFTGWGGDCGGTGGCTLTMSDPRGVMATFVNPPPTVTLDPAPPAIISGAVALSAAADDNAGIARVDFLADGGKVGEAAVRSQTTGRYGFTWDSRALPDGAHTVGARAWDVTPGAALSGTTGAAVVVDNLSPVVAIIAGPDGQTFGPGSTQTWTFTTADAGSGVASVQCRIDTAAFGACTTPASETVGNLPGAAHSLTVRAIDRAGHATEAARTFTIDATPPRTTITDGPEDGAAVAAAEVTFAFKVSEAATVQCRVYPAALTPPAFDSCSGATSHTARGFAPGTYTFDVRATDLAGNVEPKPASRTFTSTGPGPNGRTTPDAAPSGGKAAIPRSRRLETLLLFLRVVNVWQWQGDTTRVMRLALGGLPARTHVTVSCAGRHGACPYRRRHYTARRHRLPLVAPFKGRALPSHTRLTLRLVIPRFGIHEIRFTTRAGAYPQRVDLCPRHRSTRLTPCG